MRCGNWWSRPKVQFRNWGELSGVLGTVYSERAFGITSAPPGAYVSVRAYWSIGRANNWMMVGSQRIANPPEIRVFPLSNGEYETASRGDQTVWRRISSQSSRMPISKARFGRACQWSVTYEEA